MFVCPFCRFYRGADRFRKKGPPRMQNYVGVVTKVGSSGRALHLFVVSFVVWWALLALFNQFPGIDLAVANSVFSEANCSVLTRLQKSCGTFPLDGSNFFRAVRNILYAIPYVAVVFLIATLAYSRWKDGLAWRTEQVETRVAALTSLALGCGLLVNLILKTFSGRPRPRDTLFFGGDLNFVQAGSFAGKCLKNCSFISGEASSAGWLFCLILLLPERWRMSIGVPLVIVSIVTPVLRVLMGAHYLSDVVLGWLSSIVIFAGLLAILEGRRRPAIR